MIAFHGTSKENADRIRRTGFKEGTYFAYKREDAIAFGGNHVFSVAFSDDPKMWRGEPDGWQFWIRESLQKELIREYLILTDSP